MKNYRHRREPPDPDREMHLALAILRFRKWDLELIEKHGPLYYRRMGFSVH
ncbi:hypothetical protein [Bradyrhizobium neotropicale]|uniref:hypothetical protein n=1 Tax=Bradyrhizobium neotropicale TaxID=1497615 RepID=UPI001AD7BBFA|nr:hypothetical protein [Bradyrhizobium neotropicale]MBO4227226.1 hypothetical protein [Bradyrhizobium neotropicale]